VFRMARPLRYEAAGAVYHVMARGDGGKDVFEDDKDRFAWTDLLEKAHGRFGWRVHAWVLMGNHFHLLLETPEPNLVTGMKWMLGVFSQGWNRRRQRKGHVFQGRYKAVVVNGEAADGSYFKIVADYIHLNPVRSGWVGGGTGKRLRSWRWSSFAAYAGGKVPGWLDTGRVLRAFRLSEDGRGGKAYAGYLEARAKDRKAVVSDEALAELRRGWYLGEGTFGEKVLEAIKAAVGGERKRSSVGGEAAKAHDEVEAERLVEAALAALGAPGDAAALTGRGRWKDEKEMAAALVRSRTGMANRWVSARLGMGHEVSVTRAVRRFRDDSKAARRLKALERKLGIC
jgi:REP element-mobilizing transposase RayT